jgi:hypothetical protein
MTPPKKKTTGTTGPGRFFKKRFEVYISVYIWDKITDWLKP